MFTALIVDDEMAVYPALCKLGDWERYQIGKIVYASNAEDAEKVMYSLQPSLVFLDICMPGLNGIDLLRNASTQYRHTAFIVVSGYSEFKYAQDALRYGASDYLLKPVIPQELNNAIWKAMTAIYPDIGPQAEGESAKKTAKEAVVQIKNILDRNYDKPFRLQEYAEKNFFSKEYLSRLFKEEYQKSISEYLVDIRMKQAKSLLNREDMSIAEVATRVGYSDTKYFSKVFKAYFGHSPKQFR